MRKVRTFLSLLIVTFMITSCSDESDDAIIEIEYLGYSNFIIDNKTDFDLQIEFITSDEDGNELDDTKSVSSNSSTLILQDEMINGNPRPTNSLSEIRLFREINQVMTEVYTMSPIDDDSWVLTDRISNDGGLDTFEYTLTITNQDLN
ncbi:hypothetical protein [Luteirhabdus pelagi]|uniref:hypothetical protein n=1 Tax=Luteirhabdus pelagi TaxID=2792783 RepID=UPI00193ADECA|nr:hypothetical protein [Luteirhabdus pelagi]